jgi:hypothetical protein
MLAGFATSGWTAFLLAWRLCRHWGAALFAGALFTYSHYHVTHLTSHLNLVATQVLPLFLLAWLAFLDRPRALRGALAGLAFALVLTVDFYYLVFSALAGAALAVHRLVQTRGAWLRESRPWPGVAAFLAVSAAACGPWVARLLWENATDPYVGAHDAGYHGMDLLSALVPGRNWRWAEWTQGVWGRIRGGEDGEQSVYLGLSLLLPAAWGFWRCRRRPDAQGLLVVAVLFFLFALGPRVTVLDRVVLERLTVYELLQTLLPPLQMGGTPVRGIVMAVAAASALAALGFAAAPRPVRVVLVALLLFELWPNVPATPLVPSDWALELRKLPPGAVHGPGEDEFPFAKDHWHQTVHGKPMTTGYTARWPASRFARFDELDRLVREERFEELFARYRVRYVVLPYLRHWEWRRRGLKPVFFGGARVIYVAAADPLPAAERARNAGPGVTVTNGRIDLRSPEHRGRRYLALFSASDAPWTRLPGGVTVALADDPLLRASLDPHSPVFRGHHGSFDPFGSAAVELRLPEAIAARLGKLRFSLLLFDAAGRQVEQQIEGEVPLR